MHWYGWIVAITAALGGFLFGYEIGIINQVLVMKPFRCAMRMSNCIDDKDSEDVEFLQGLTTASFLIGCIPGAGSMALWQDAIGRKRAIWGGAFVFAISGIVQGLAPSFDVVCIGRAIGGVGVGILSAVVPLYIAEVSPPEIRGRLTSAQQLMITIGILCANAVNAILIVTIEDKNDEGEWNDSKWRVALGVQSVPGFLLLIAMFVLPYSPRWLMLKGKDEQGLKALAKLRRKDARAPEVQEEYHEIQQAVEHEAAIGDASWGELARPGIRNRVSIGVLLQFFQQWTGINVIMYYSSLLFVQMGFEPDFASSVNTTINSVVNVVGTFPGMWAIETPKIGRKNLMILGGIAQAFAMGMLTVFVNLITTVVDEDGELQPAPADQRTSADSVYGVISTIFVYLFVLAFAASWGPVVWVYQSEIFPLRIRGKGTGLATMSNWITNTFITFIWPFAIKSFRAYQYLWFMGTGLIMAGFAWKFVPETKGRSLEDMDELFGFKSGYDDAPKA